MVLASDTPPQGGRTRMRLAAANQVQVSIESALAVLDRSGLELRTAEDRPRAVAGTGVDAVILARRATSGWAAVVVGIGRASSIAPPPGHRAESMT